MQCFSPRSKTTLYLNAYKILNHTYQNGFLLFLQATAYLLMSALSAAIPITNRMREGSDNVFTDSSAASISMAFFAFVCLALSALISGFKLSKQTYI
uniref:CASP-like protein n=1 Tax=Aegilops tauschii subsp. strangulata TaxID=200361 RepID=A0A452YRN5_AEGTS